MAARTDEWLSELQQGVTPKLLAALPDTSFNKLRARFEALNLLRRDEAIAAAAVKFFHAFAVRNREQLEAAAAATGTAWLHRAPASSFNSVKPVKAPNRLVGPWHHAVCRSLAAALSANRPGGAELDALLESFAEGPSTQVTERAVTLLTYPRDARIAEAAAAFIARPTMRWSAEVALFTVIALLLSVHGGPRQKKAANALADAVPPLAWVLLALPAADAAASKAAQPRSDSALELLRAIAEDPGDDAPRAVLTDWLLAQGDPRGELMALQRAGRPLTPKEAKRVAALQKKHEKKWVGSLGRALKKGSAVFREGVLREAELQVWGTLADLPLEDEPQLATLEVLHLEGGTNLPLARLLSSAPRFRSLKSLTAKPWVLAGASVPLLNGLESLGIIEDFGHEKTALDVLKRARLPRLRTLRLLGNFWADAAAVAALPQFGQLTKLVVETTSPQPWLKLRAGRLQVEAGKRT